MALVNKRRAAAAAAANTQRQRTSHNALTPACTVLHCKVCSVNIGKAEVKIVTNAANVAEGSRVVVACVGAIVQGDALKKKTVGGRAARPNVAVPWQCPPSPALAPPPQGASCGSGRLDTPSGRPSRYQAQPLPRVLELVATKVADSAALDHARPRVRRHASRRAHARLDGRRCGRRRHRARGLRAWGPTAREETADGRQVSAGRRGDCVA